MAKAEEKHNHVITGFIVFIIAFALAITAFFVYTHEVRVDALVDFAFDTKIKLQGFHVECFEEKIVERINFSMIKDRCAQVGGFYNCVTLNTSAYGGEVMINSQIIIPLSKGDGVYTETVCVKEILVRN